MTLLARGNWGPGAAVQERIDHVLKLMDAQQLSKAASIIAISAFTTLKRAYTLLAAGSATTTQAARCQRRVSY